MNSTERYPAIYPKKTVRFEPELEGRLLDEVTRRKNGGNRMASENQVIREALGEYLDRLEARTGEEHEHVAQLLFVLREGDPLAKAALHAALIAAAEYTRKSPGNYSNAGEAGGGQESRP